VIGNNRETANETTTNQTYGMELAPLGEQPCHPVQTFVVTDNRPHLTTVASPVEIVAATSK
jgi:hypothetical protein